MTCSGESAIVIARKLSVSGRYCVLSAVTNIKTKMELANARAIKMPDYVSNTVYSARTEKGMTQEELAEKVGVSRQTIIAIEKGNYTPSVMLALKIARTFKMCVDDLFHI